MTSSKPQFQWDDPFFLEAQLSDEERMVRDAAKAFADDILMPRVIGDFRDEAFAVSYTHLTLPTICSV